MIGVYLILFREQEEIVEEDMMNKWNIAVDEKEKCNSGKIGRKKKKDYGSLCELELFL